MPDKQTSARAIAAVLILSIAAFGTVATLEWPLRFRSDLGRDSSQDVTVFSAASLGDVMNEVAAAFTEQTATQQTSNRGRVYFNLAGSNVLAQQIVASSQADLFLSANEKWMDYVDDKGRLVQSSRTPFLENRLVVIAHGSSDWKLDNPTDLPRIPFRYLSLGDPEAVPAGIYAKAYLRSIPVEAGDLWAAVADRVAPATNVTAALALVEADPSVLGIVYRTDAAASQRVRVLYEIPDNALPSIRYVAARVRRDGESANAERFFEFLFSDDARAIFVEHGFVPVSRNAPAGELRP